jgi:hypothetical protein
MFKNMWEKMWALTHVPKKDDGLDDTPDAPDDWDVSMHLLKKDCCSSDPNDFGDDGQPDPKAVTFAYIVCDTDGKYAVLNTNKQTLSVAEFKKLIRHQNCTVANMLRECFELKYRDEAKSLGLIPENR